MVTLTASQCRAARALLAWSQDQLAEASQVAKATIANFELGKRTPYDRTLGDLRQSLEAAGVQFIAENGGGAGVRLAKPAAVVLGLQTDQFDRILRFDVRYRGRSYQMRLSLNVLDDLDGSNHDTDSAYEDAFRRHQCRILNRAIAKIDGLQTEEVRQILLAVADF